MAFPSEVPVLLLSADNNKKDKMERYRAAHLKKLGEHAKGVVMKGSNHSNIYHDSNYRKIVCDAVNDFLEKSVEKNRR